MSDYEFSPDEDSDFEGNVELSSGDDGFDDELVFEDDTFPHSTSPNYQRTQMLGMGLAGQNLCQKVVKILEFMERESIDLPLFLDAISWGDADCISNDKIKYARTALMGSRQLPDILKRWHKPPRTKSKGQRAKGGHDPLEKFAIACVTEKIQKEMDDAADMFKISETCIVEEDLLSLHLNELKLEAQSQMPVFWSILESASKKKRKKSFGGNADMVCCIINNGIDI